MSGLSKTVDLHLHYAQSQWCWHAVITRVGNPALHMSVHGDNTTPISNAGVAQLGPWCGHEFKSRWVGL